MSGKINNVITVNLDQYLTKSKTGDEEAIKKLYVEMKRQIFVLALSIVNEYQTAEDILQETFVKMLDNNLEGYKSGSNAKAWIMTIARNTAFNYLKKKKRETIVDEISTVNDSDFTEEVESTIEFMRLIKNLSREEREIVSLKLSAGLSYIQISRIMNISIINLRAKYSRAIKKIKRNLE